MLAVCWDDIGEELLGGVWAMIYFIAGPGS